MKSLHIRDVPPDVVSSLKRLARHHHRSMQGELRAILDRAARMAPAENAEPIRLKTVKTRGTTHWRREEIYGDEER